LKNLLGLIPYRPTIRPSCLLPALLPRTVAYTHFSDTLARAESFDSYTLYQFVRQQFIGPDRLACTTETKIDFKDLRSEMTSGGDHGT
jgi:hypothetical protein